LKLALQSGIGLIDTSSNYGDGDSERLIGGVLCDLIAKAKVNRDDIFLVSKAGYIQGQNLDMVKQAEKDGSPYKDVVDYAEGLQHCIHPGFLKDQLDNSLTRLGFDRLDAFLLHNPEYWMSWCEAHEIDREKAREDYYRRIGQAFVYLESEVRNGRIGCYGISSNTFVEPEDAFAHTSLTRVWEIAQGMGPDHNFRIAQFPLNLYESGPVLLNNQPGGETLLEFAANQGITTLINRPLNAIVGERLHRLADYGEVIKPSRQRLLEVLTEFKNSEEHIMQDFISNLGLESGYEKKIKQQLALAVTLILNWEKFAGLQHYLGVQSGYVAPRLNAAAASLARLLADRHDALRVLDKHLGMARVALETVQDWYTAEAGHISSRIAATTRQVDPDWRQASNLSQMAVRAIRSTRGVGAVLVGMRRPEYVEDMLVEMNRPVEQKDRNGSWAALKLPKDQGMFKST
jgi:aryl-alcohol dehydrogenase-like predicted oxidoreductase